MDGAKTLIQLLIGMIVAILVLATIGLINNGTAWYDQRAAAQTRQAADDRRETAIGSGEIQVSFPDCPRGQRVYVTWDGKFNHYFCK